MTNKENPMLGFAGRYQLTKHKADAEGNPIPGTEEVVLPWFDNLITNAGLDMLGVGAGESMADNLRYCQLGTSSTPPSFTDTGMGNRVGSAHRTSEVRGVSTDSTYLYRRVTYRFPAGSASGVNLSEVGVSPASSGSVFSRSLLKDTGGVATAITLSADEILDVVYELRVHPSTSTVSGTFTIDGVSTTVTAEPRNFPADPAWSGSVEGEVSVGLGSIGKTAVFPGIPNDSFFPRYVYESNSAPSGTYSAISGRGSTPYVPGSYQRLFHFKLGLGDGNFSSGIGYLTIAPTADNFNSSGLGYYTYRFTPKIQKNNTKTGEIVVGVSWGRYTP